MNHLLPSAEAKKGLCGARKGTLHQQSKKWAVDCPVCKSMDDERTRLMLAMDKVWMEKDLSPTR